MKEEEEWIDGKRRGKRGSVGRQSGRRLVQPLRHELYPVVNFFDPVLLYVIAPNK